MYSSFSSAPPSIFFPPRLEVVVKKQNPDGFASHSRYQSPFYRLFGHQAHGPSGKAFRRIAADYGDNTLALAVFQQGGRAGPFLLIQCPLEPPLPVTMPNLANG